LLPVGILKIDRFFVEGLCANPTDREIVEKAIALGARLGRKVIAEGVETEEIGTALLEMGIRHAQGFAVARPMPPEDIFAWIEAYTSPASWRAAVSGAPARAEV
jgi:EAL domain-containing protein (putative c-di-GMP-specific phosphodiesterase class I)